MQRKYLATVATVIAALSAALVAHAQGHRGHAKDEDPEHDKGSGPSTDADDGSDVAQPTLAPSYACSDNPHPLCGSCFEQGTCVPFSGFCWTIKDSDGNAVGPGPNYFRTNNVSVDNQCRLHLRITKQGAVWTTAEVIAQASLGHGRYQVMYEDTPLNLFNENVVLALFTWNNAGAQAHREIDIEFSKWGNRFNTFNAQYVVQPATQGRIFRWNIDNGAATSTHWFDWQANSVLFHSDVDGQHPEWRFTGRVPRPGGENPRMNLWLFQGRAPSNGMPVEVIVRSFTHDG